MQYQNSVSPTLNEYFQSVAFTFLNGLQNGCGFQNAQTCFIFPAGRSKQAPGRER